MNCREFDRRLDELLEGRLPDRLRREVREHLEACPRCRELETLARASLEAPPVESGGDLTDAVLSRTTGPACERAHDRLGDLVDGALRGSEEELVRLHLERCRPCHALAEILTWLAEELPAMAEIEPDSRFVSDVMRATARRRRRLAEIVTASRDWWAGLAWRPRFAMEGAYVGAMILWFTFGSAISPLREIPAQAAALTRINPAQTLGVSSLGPVPDLSVQPAAIGREIWGATGEKVLTSTQPARADWAGRISEVGELSKSLTVHGARLCRTTFSGDLDESRSELKAMGADLRSIWQAVRKRSTTKNLKAQEA